VWLQAELAEFFVLAGLVMLFARSRPDRRQGVVAALGGVVVLAAVWGIERWFKTLAVGGDNVLLQILAFFMKAGAFVFGSGLAIVPFLHQGVVQQFGWLTEHQFVDAVAVAMITPGPVVITVVFIGFLVAGLAGAVMAAIGIFMPVYLFTIVPAPWFSRNRDNPQLKAFVQGATAAATGAIAGSVVVIALRAIYDVPTALLALATFAVLWRFKVPEPIVVAAAGLVGLVAWSLVKGG
jgi:chromate transporter